MPKRFILFFFFFIRFVFVRAWAADVCEYTRKRDGRTDDGPRSSAFHASPEIVEPASI